VTPLPMPAPHDPTPHQTDTLFQGEYCSYDQH